MNFFQKNKKLISIIIAFIIIALVIILPVYFLVIKKSSSTQSESNKPSLMNPSNTLDSNNLGFCAEFMLSNGETPPKRFFDLNWTKRMIIFADNGDKDALSDIQYKWGYDNTNPLYLIRTITNSNKNYTDSELNSLGPTSSSTSYVVNQLILIYDKTSSKYNENGLAKSPMVLSTKSQCM